MSGESSYPHVNHLMILHYYQGRRRSVRSRNMKHSYLKTGTFKSWKPLKSGNSRISGKAELAGEAEPAAFWLYISGALLYTNLSKLVHVRMNLLLIHHDHGGNNNHNSTPPPLFDLASFWARILKIGSVKIKCRQYGLFRPIHERAGRN